MSIFYISNDSKKVKTAKSRLKSVFGTNFTTERLTTNYSMTFIKEKVIRKEIKNGQIFGFGLFFNENGFFNDALKDVSSLSSFMAIYKSNLFGHFTFIIIENQNLHIITDKIGMLNVFYNYEPDFFSISSDLTLVATLIPDVKLSEQGVKEFIFKESTISETTVFKGIRRLKFGNKIYINQNILKEEKSCDYKMENLTFLEYTERIKKYFKLLNKYNGNISSDISGGFDTRLVTAIAHNTILNLQANTNPNQFDGGIDDTLSPIITEKLNLKLLKIENKNECNNKIKMLHLFSMGRDILRSKFWPSRLENKYKYLDLSLGGYGGESIRSKYNEKSPLEYYESDIIKRVLKDTKYEINVTHALKDYSSFKTNNQLTNFIYTVDRMRVWGGTQVYGNFVYGATLHPFMDWHLINPIFNMDSEELKGGKFQEKLILYFAPQLKNIPINKLSHSRLNLNDIKEMLKKQIVKSTILTKLIKLLLFDSKKRRQKVESLYKIYPKSQILQSEFEKIGIDISCIEKDAQIEVLSRLITVNTVFKYLKNKVE